MSQWVHVVQVIIWIVLLGSSYAQNCEECLEGFQCCLLQGEYQCTSTLLFNCGKSSPYSACSVEQCPIPTDHVLCNVGSHRFYHCRGENCCSNTVEAAFIRPAEQLPAALESNIKIVSYTILIVSTVVFLCIMHWENVRTKNTTVILLNLIGHFIMLYYGFFPDSTVSCYVQHFVGGPAIYQFSWNARIFHMMFQNQVYHLEQLKRKQLFAKKIGQTTMQQIKKQESFVVLLASPTFGLFLGLCSLIYGATVLHVLTDISMFETSTCICPHINMGKYGLTMGFITYVILGTLAMRYHESLDVYSTRWETYTYIVGRFSLQIMIIVLFWVIHVIMHQALALTSTGQHVYSPFVAGKLALAGACLVDIFVTVWIPLVYGLRQKLFGNAPKPISKNTLDHDDLFLGQLATYAVREYSVDAVLCWRMIRKIQEERSTKQAICLTEFFLERKATFSHVDIRACIKDMKDVNDALNEKYLSYAEEQIRVLYLEPLADRMMSQDGDLIKSMTVISSFGS